MKHRRADARIIGPLCEAWDDPHLDLWWPDCYHQSCWAIVAAELDPGTGLRSRKKAS